MGVRVYGEWVWVYAEGGVWVYGEGESGCMESGRGGVWRVDEGVYAEWA